MSALLTRTPFVGSNAPMLPPNIAIVHNDTAVSSLLVTFLEDAGYLPVTYRGPGDALEQMRGSQPDLAIIDLGLHPGQMGGSLVDQLRSDSLTLRIPIIVLTTSNDPESVRPESCQYNCEMLPEPFDLDTVQGLIRSLLKSPQHCHCG